MNDKNPWENDRKVGETDIFKDLVDKIKAILKNVNNGNYNGNNGQHGNIIWVVVILLFFAWLASGFYKIQPDEQGVVLRLGKWVRTTSSGLSYRIPYPIEEVIVQKVTTINRIDVGNRPGSADDTVEENLMLTGDSNLANINFTVLWKIGDVENFLFTARSPEVIIRAVAESVMRSTIGRNTIVYAQTSGRSDISNEVKLKLQELMDEYNTGVEIVAVNLQNVEPPVVVIDSFRDVERAQADQQRMINEADAYQRNILAHARGRAFEITSKAAGNKAEIIAEADGLTSRFLAVYKQYKANPTIVGKRIYFDTMQEMLKTVELILMDKSSGLLPHINLKNSNNGVEL